METVWHKLLLLTVVAGPIRATGPGNIGMGVSVQAKGPGGGCRQYYCPPRFVRMGSSCYYLSPYMNTWQGAHFECRNMGAQLAVFEKPVENRNMRHYLMNHILTPLERWIGGVFQHVSRRWIWGSSGTQIAYKAFPRRMVNRDWQYHCIAMDPSVRFLWKPRSCFDRKHYICETPLSKRSLLRIRKKHRKKQDHKRVHDKNRPGKNISNTRNHGEFDGRCALSPVPSTAFPPPWTPRTDMSRRRRPLNRTTTNYYPYYTPKPRPDEDRRIQDFTRNFGFNPSSANWLDKNTIVKLEPINMPYNQSDPRINRLKTDHWMTTYNHYKPDDEILSNEIKSSQ